MEPNETKRRRIELVAQVSASASSGPCRVPRGCLKVAIDLPGCHLLEPGPDRPPGPIRKGSALTMPTYLQGRSLAAEAGQ